MALLWFLVVVLFVANPWHIFVAGQKYCDVETSINAAPYNTVPL